MDSLSGFVVIGQEKEGKFILNIRIKVFYAAGDEELEQVAQKVGECPISGNIQVRLYSALSISI